MSQNNVKIKVTAKEQAISPYSEDTFNQNEFIKNIYECEKYKYILENRQNRLLKRIKNKYFCPDFFDTNFYKQYDKKSKNHIKRPNKPKKNVFSWPDELLYGAFRGVPIGIACTIIFLIVNKIFTGLLGDFELGFGALIAIVSTVIFFIKSKINNDNSYERALKSYEETCKKFKEEDERIDKYNDELHDYWHGKYEEYKDNIINSAQKYEENIMPELNEIKRELDDVSGTLQSLYNLRINGVLCLHPSYQGLIPISIIYGYFETGRCTQLQGHEGAYNLYEDEKMKGLIINKLDTVSKQLGHLQNTMCYVGQAIEECNSRLSELESASDRMINSVNSINSNVTQQLNGVSNQMSAIEENTANSAYYAEVGARMTAFQTAYNLLND